MKKLNDFFEQKYVLYDKKINDSNTLEDLLETYNNIKSDLTDKWDITLINDMYTFLFTYLSGENNKQKIGQISNLESMKPLLALKDLRYDYEKFGCSSMEFDKSFNEYIALYGDRVLHELKLETRTYKTNPELLLEYIKNDNNITISPILEKKSLNPFVKNAKKGKRMLSFLLSQLDL